MSSDPSSRIAPSLPTALGALLDCDVTERAQVEASHAYRPDLPEAELLACRSLRQLGRPAEAVPRLAELVRRQPLMLGAAWELAQAASAAGETALAVATLERLTRQQPAVASGWFLLAKAFRAIGREEAGWRADLSGVHASTRDPELVRAAMAMNEGRLTDAAAMVEARLVRLPDDPPACRLLGEIRWRQGDLGEAIARVQHALALAPGFDLAREFLIRLLLHANRLVDGLDQARILARSPMRHPGHDLLRASVLVRLGDQRGAADIYRAVLARQPTQPQVWQNLGHVLKTLGDRAGAVDAYRHAVRHRPTMGEAWWSLANLKTVRFDAVDLDAMRAAVTLLERSKPLEAEDLFHLHFSLGKALEDGADYAASFYHYAEGNRLRRTLIRHDAASFSAEVSATAAALASLSIGSQAGGCPASDPIFIVGLPRSGSTLVEQILASHSQVEGTMELPEMMMIASRLQSRVDAGEFADHAAMIASLTAAERTRLGEEYLALTRVHRRTDRPFFIDKMPNNWQHVGLIRAILPNARIVDVRRHPASCCFSAWKQHFARGQTFSYDLHDLGRYYRDYLGLMAAFDAVVPNAVHRVIYEDLVTGTEAGVAALLAYLGLPFEGECLEFHRNDRPVRTASSEQVRQPIYTAGIDHWQHYQPWLDPLFEALGDAVQTWQANTSSEAAV